MHLPFLNADPDLMLGPFRDAFEAEGLSVIQLRNYINLGYLSITEGDKLVKMPLYNLILFLPLKIFGTHLIVARITLLSVFIISVFGFAAISSFQKVIPILCLLLLLQPLIFEYTHLVMPEMIAIGMILIAISFLVKYAGDKKTTRRYIFFASLFCALACCVKILYFYVLLIVPLSLFCFRFIPASNVSTKDIRYSIFWLFLFSAVYFVVWYLPNESFYNYVMTSIGKVVFDSHKNVFQVVYQNLRYNLLLPQSRIFMVSSFVIFLLGLWEWFRSNDVKFKAIFISVFLWVMLESHKLVYAYFPPRYQVSLFFSVGLMSSVVLAHFLFSSEATFRKKIMAIIVLGVLVCLNGFDYFGLYGRRQYSIQQANEYMKNAIHDPKKTILGSWAPSLTWESRSRAAPVWYNVLNDKNTLKVFKPVVGIIAEESEEDSDSAYIHQGIDLNAISDSVKHFSIGKWNLNLYWIRQQE